ncbi:hypothetical protein BOW52_08970 [Solemya elarraichensis gill symbiont]|uniref:TonB-dependent receptor-like beta-barrel domain-containing protein n=1 Tax=Solemya elarraichensis gill symbiont TaxID=1918949 RepID=A0A1T2KZI3_9GAMM|nr:hypothetical protein BOW52_08970 [Solemya elarraichensis gill symbiont]
MSPKFSATYQNADNQNAYFRYANGFRIPQASRLYMLSTNNSAFTLDPETTDTFEVGYKLSGDNTQFEAAVYHMIIDDTIVRRTIEGGANDGDRYYVNGGKTLHQGVEVSVDHQFNKEFGARLAYSYSEHTYDNDDVYGNNEQAEAPNHLANLRLTYKPSKLPGLTTMFEVEHVGDYWMDDKNTRTYDGYTVGHLKATYDASDRLSFNAKLNNITDEIYAESATYGYGKEKYTPAAPRQLFVGLEYKL